MEATVTALTTAVTPTILFASLATLAPLIGMGLVVGFALTIGRRVIGKLGKGKGGI